MKISVNWLKDFVKIQPPVEQLAERLTMAGLEVKKVEPTQDQKDFVFEIEITTNRPDWLSHWGVAREIAAVDNLSLKVPTIEGPTQRPMPPGWKIQLKEAEGCPYYTGILIEGIQWNATPDFMKEKLQAVGLRSVNLIVDITNYALLETGQPLHAFDADLLRGKEIQIRRAKPGERMVAINGNGVELQAKDLVIADSERSVAIAGIMGSKDSEISERTRNIFLESAFFHPAWVRQSSRRLGLASDSSYRFERRVDPEGVDFGRERAVYLIKQYAKPRFVSGVLKAGQKPVTFRGRIHLRAADIETSLGIKLKPHQIVSILTRVGLDVRQDSIESWNVGIPSFRCDLTEPADLIEEVARLYGYDNIPESLPARAPLPNQENPRLRLEERARQYFSGAGFYETVTFSLISGEGLDPELDLKEAVNVVNPQNKELTWMRPVLLPSLVEAVKRNHHFGARGVPLFEIANIYCCSSKGKHPEEERVLSIALCGRFGQKSWLDPEREVTFYDLKGTAGAFLESLGIGGVSYKPAAKSFLKETGAENILIGSEVVGFLGAAHDRFLQLADLDFNIYFAELSLQKVLPHVRWIKSLRELSRFPAVKRDLAIVVSEETKAGEIEREIESLSQGLVRRVEVFDLFRGGRIPKGSKNLAFRLTYQSLEKTLVSEEIQRLHASIAETVAKKFQASFQ